MAISRRRFLQMLGVVGIGAAGIGTYTMAPGITGRVKRWLGMEEVTPVHLMQIVGANNDTSRTIVWQSETPLTAAQVEVRNPSGTTMRYTVNDETFTDGGDTIYWYVASIDGLQGNTTYAYRIIDQTGSTEWMSLITCDDDTIESIIFPDSQCSDYDVWQHVANLAVEQHKNAQLMITIGDLVDNGEDNRQWSRWMEGIEPAVHNIPLAPIMGNHETYSLQWEVRFPHGYLNRFAVPNTGLPDFKRQFYTFDWGPVHFVALDTQQREMEEMQPDLQEQQAQWFRQAVQSTDKPWTIVLMHKDPLQYAFNRAVRDTDRAEGFSDDGRFWMPLFDEYGVDVVLSGHLHTYRNRGRIYNFERSEQGPLYLLTGIAGDVRYNSLWAPHALDVMVPPQPEEDNYVYMSGNREALTFTMYDATGAVLDTVTIHK